MSSSDRPWKITCFVDLWSTPTKLPDLASNRMQYLMEQFETAFDLVIYDTPILLVSRIPILWLLYRWDLDGYKSGKTNESEVMHVLNR